MADHIEDAATAAALVFEAVIDALGNDDVDAAAGLVVAAEARVVEFLADEPDADDPRVRRLLTLWKRASDEARAALERIAAQQQQLGVSQRARKAYG